jgi:hypothetical protein
VIPGFCQDVEKICALLVESPNLRFLTLVDGTTRLSLNVGMELPIYAA